MPNPKYEWAVKDWTYEYSRWGPKKMSNLLEEMDANGWELVTAFGQTGFRAQNDVPAKFIFRKIKET